jgi:hypothetical protein
MTVMQSPRPRKRVMGFFGVTMFIISAILVADQLTASASIGVGSVGRSGGG